MLYHYLIFIVTYVDVGLDRSAIAMSLEDPVTFLENEDSIQTRRVLRDYGDKIIPTKPLEHCSFLSETRHINLRSAITNPYSNQFNDVYWRFQWYAHDQRTSLGPVMDHNIVPSYKKGYTGKGVVVGIIGDGVKKGIEDLPNVKGSNWEEYLSILFQENPDVKNDGKMSAEGTMMAGVIAMKENNKICGVGVAYDAQIVGIKIFKEKSSIGYGYKFKQAITFDKYDGAGIFGTLCDIYAFAIGRPDDGMYMANPYTKKDVMKGFKRGISEGRNGRGSIYVVGAGDGKTEAEDNCGADDLVNDPAAVGVASADHRGRVTEYSERCAAVMATAYSSGDGEAMVTTDVDGTCTKYYSGNNPSVAIAAGIFALTLQANSMLTARDVQHLVAMTSEVAPLVQNKGTWKKNGAGFYVSSDFGFGLLNAENMVDMATDWITVPHQLEIYEKFTFKNPVLTVGSPSTGTYVHKTSIKYLEVVEIICNVKLEYRGSITITLKSPKGTEAVMLETRPRDRNTGGLHTWRLKTAHFWAENAEGTWTVTASIVQFTEEQATCMGAILKILSQLSGHLNEIKWIKLRIHGTEEKPERYISRDRARTYSAFLSEEFHYQKG